MSASTEMPGVPAAVYLGLQVTNRKPRGAGVGERTPAGSCARTVRKRSPALYLASGYSGASSPPAVLR